MQTTSTTVVNISLEIVGKAQISGMVVVNYEANLDLGIRQSSYETEVTEDVSSVVADSALRRDLD